MKKYINAKWLLLFVIMFSLTTVNADAQRRRRGRTTRTTRTTRRAPNLGSVQVLDEGGYTNIRATPGGRVIGKVRDGSYIKVNSNDLIDHPTWIRTYTSSGSFRGYIHYTKLNTEYGLSEFGGGTSW